MANDRSKYFFNALFLENILVALTREIGDGPCFLYWKSFWVGVTEHWLRRNKFRKSPGTEINAKVTSFELRFQILAYHGSKEKTPTSEDQSIDCLT